MLVSSEGISMFRVMDLSIQILLGGALLTSLGNLGSQEICHTTNLFWVVRFGESRDMSHHRLVLHSSIEKHACSLYQFCGDFYPAWKSSAISRHGEFSW